MSEQKKSNKGLIAIIIILLLGVLGMGYMLWDKSSTIEAQDTDIAELQADIQDRISEVSRLESKNDSMDVYIVNTQAELEALLDSVKEANEVTANQLARWKNQAYRYRSQIDQLQSTVDSINAAYEALSIENEETKVNLAQEIQRGQELKSENENLSNEVAAGSKLQLTAINASAYKVLSSGEEDETGRARRAERAKACITIGANAIAEKGERMIYMRILNPSGNVIAGGGEGTDEGNMFSVNGNNMYFTASKSVWYENEDTNVCLSYDSEDWDEGIYKVEIYIDGVVTEARFVLD